MSSAGLTLEEVALLALGVPEEVKFNMLRVLLLAMLKLLNVGHHVIVRPEKDGDHETLAKLKDRAAQITSQLKERTLSSSGGQSFDGGLLDEYYEGEDEEEEVGKTSVSPNSEAAESRQPGSGSGRTSKRPATAEAGVVKRKRSSPLKRVEKSASELEAKVSQLEQKLDSLTSLPTAKQIIERAADVTRAVDNGQLQPALVSDLWQAMQMQQKIETNEQGVTQASFILPRKMMKFS